MLRAIIFDCDGVIADSEPLHLRGFRAVLADHGISLTEEDYYSRYLALDDRGAFSLALRDHGKPIFDGLLESLIVGKAEVLAREMKDRLEIFPGVREFVVRSAESYPMGIASGALRHEVELILDRAGIRACFQVVVSAEDVTRGKPDPEPFLRARELLSHNLTGGLDPAECLVFEDSIHGIRAARMAGMKCAAITNSYPADRLREADLVLETFEGISLETIESLF